MKQKKEKILKKYVFYKKTHKIDKKEKQVFKIKNKRGDIAI